MNSLSSKEEHLREALTDTISVWCRHWLNYTAKLDIDGLVGVTVDNSSQTFIQIKSTHLRDDAKQPGIKIEPGTSCRTTSLGPKEEHLREALTDTITMLCRHVINYSTKLDIDGTIGVTLDNTSRFYIPIKASHHHRIPVTKHLQTDTTVIKIESDSEDDLKMETPSTSNQKAGNDKKTTTAKKTASSTFRPSLKIPSKKESDQKEQSTPIKQQLEAALWNIQPLSGLKQQTKNAHTPKSPPRQIAQSGILRTPPGQTQQQIILQIPPGQSQHSRILQTPPGRTQQQRFILPTPPGQSQQSRILQTPPGQTQQERILQTPPGQSQQSRILQTPPGRTQQQRFILPTPPGQTHQSRILQTPPRNIQQSKTRKDMIQLIIERELQSPEPEPDPQSSTLQTPPAMTQQPGTLQTSPGLAHQSKTFQTQPELTQQSRTVQAPSMLNQHSSTIQTPPGLTQQSNTLQIPQGMDQQPLQTSLGLNQLLRTLQTPPGHCKHSSALHYLPGITPTSKTPQTKQGITQQSMTPPRLSQQSRMLQAASGGSTQQAKPLQKPPGLTQHSSMLQTPSGMTQQSRTILTTTGPIQQATSLQKPPDPTQHSSMLQTPPGMTQQSSKHQTASGSAQKSRPIQEMTQQSRASSGPTQQSSMLQTPPGMTQQSKTLPLPTGPNQKSRPMTQQSRSLQTPPGTNQKSSMRQTAPGITLKSIIRQPAPGGTPRTVQTPPGLTKPLRPRGRPPLNPRAPRPARLKSPGPRLPTRQQVPSARYPSASTFINIAKRYQKEKDSAKGIQDSQWLSNSTTSISLNCTSAPMYQQHGSQQPPKVITATTTTPTTRVQTASRRSTSHKTTTCTTDKNRKIESDTPDASTHSSSTIKDKDLNNNSYQGRNQNLTEVQNLSTAELRTLAAAYQRGDDSADRGQPSARISNASPASSCSTIAFDADQHTVGIIPTVPTSIGNQQTDPIPSKHHPERKRKILVLKRETNKGNSLTELNPNEVQNTSDKSTEFNRINNDQPETKKSKTEGDAKKPANSEDGSNSMPSLIIKLKRLNTNDDLGNGLSSMTNSTLENVSSSSIEQLMYPKTLSLIYQQHGNQQPQGRKPKSDKGPPSKRRIIDDAFSEVSGDISEEEEDDEDSSSVKYQPGTKVKTRYGKGKNLKFYEAKVLTVEDDGELIEYKVHYTGWNSRYDEWLTKDRIVGLSTGSKDKVKVPKGSAETPQKSSPSLQSLSGSSTPRSSASTTTAESVDHEASSEQSMSSVLMTPVTPKHQSPSVLNAPGSSKKSSSILKTPISKSSSTSTTAGTAVTAAISKTFTAAPTKNTSATLSTTVKTALITHLAKSLVASAGQKPPAPPASTIPTVVNCLTAAPVPSCKLEPIDMTQPTRSASTLAGGLQPAATTQTFQHPWHVDPQMLYHPLLNSIPLTSKQHGTQQLKGIPPSTATTKQIEQIPSATPTSHKTATCTTEKTIKEESNMNTTGTLDTLRTISTSELENAFNDRDLNDNIFTKFLGDSDIKGENLSDLQNFDELQNSAELKVPASALHSGDVSAESGKPTAGISNVSPASSTSKENHETDQTLSRRYPERKRRISALQREANKGNSIAEELYPSDIHPGDAAASDTDDSAEWSNCNESKKRKSKTQSTS